MDDARLTELKQKVNSSSILSAREKEEWLFLLPRMSEEQVAELEKMLEIKVPAEIATGVKPAGEQSPYAGQKIGETVHKDLSTEELAELAEEAASKKSEPSILFVSPVQPSLGKPAPEKQAVRPPDPFLRPAVPAKPVQKPVQEFTPPKPVPTPPPPKPVEPKPVLPTPSQMIDAGTPSSDPELGKATIEDLRAAPSPYMFFDGLTAKAKELLRTDRLGKLQIAAVFKRSPLYQTYLASGMQQMRGESLNLLTTEEFQLIADFADSLSKIHLGKYEET